MKGRIILTFLLTLGTAAAVSQALPPPAQPAKESACDRSGKPMVSEEPVPTPSRLSVTPPALTDGIFPCSDCHAEMKPDLQRRELRDEHTAIFLQHAAGQLWCLDCHHPEDRDTLRLVTGEGILFAESFRLCGQCHGKQLRAWQVGIHGRRTGHWNGEKEYMLCTRCHNPHIPRFQAPTPLPPPERPGRTGH
jgi:hypothetical protein